jgi:hypothetical protein
MIARDGQLETGLRITRRQPRLLLDDSRNVFSVPSLDEVLAEFTRLQPRLAARHVGRIGVFGSVARGEARPDSDVDILVDMTGEGDLFDLVAVKLLLEEALGRRIDVVPIGGSKTDARETVLREVRYAA